VDFPISFLAAVFESPLLRNAQKRRTETHDRVYKQQTTAAPQGPKKQKEAGR
jgi:hypothetical protein